MRQYWEPRREIRELRARVEQAFRLAHQHERTCRPAGTLAPPVDFAADDEGFVVTVDLPGVKREEVQVLAERGALLISGEKKLPETGEGAVLRRERTYGTFCRSIALPDEADLSQVAAKLRQGQLEVRIPRQAPAAPRKVDIIVD